MEIECSGRSASAKKSALASGRGGLAQRIRGAHCYFDSVGLLGSILDPTQCSHVVSLL